MKQYLLTIYQPDGEPPAQEVLDRVIATIPVGRLGEPDEVARVVEFLADPDSGYITGEILDINGGLYM